MSSGLFSPARNFSILGRGMNMKFTRRQFIQTSAAAAAGAGLARYSFADAPAEAVAKAAVKLVPKADAMIHLWLPGGIAQTDTWDPKKYTPFRPGMKGSELLGPCGAFLTQPTHRESG